MASPKPALMSDRTAAASPRLSANSVSFWPARGAAKCLDNPSFVRVTGRMTSLKSCRQPSFRPVSPTVARRSGGAPHAQAAYSSRRSSSNRRSRSVALQSAARRVRHAHPRRPAAAARRGRRERIGFHRLRHARARLARDAVPRIGSATHRSPTAAADAARNAAAAFSSTPSAPHAAAAGSAPGAVQEACQRRFTGVGAGRGRGAAEPLVVVRGLDAGRGVSRARALAPAALSRCRLGRRTGPLPALPQLAAAGATVHAKLDDNPRVCERTRVVVGES
jgi:hypothetical protein